MLSLEDVKIRIRGAGAQSELIHNIIDNDLNNKIDYLNMHFNKVVEDYNWSDFLIVSLDEDFILQSQVKFMNILLLKKTSYVLFKKVSNKSIIRICTFLIFLIII